MKAFRNTDEIIAAAAAASSAKKSPTTHEESPALQQTQRPVNTLSSSIRRTDVVSHHRRSNYFTQEQGGDIHDCSVNHKKRSAPPASLSPAAHRTTHGNYIHKKDFVDLNQHIKPPQEMVCHFDNNTILSYHGSYKRPRLPNEEKYAVLVEIEDHTGSLQLHRDEPRSPDNKLQIIKSDHEMHVETKPAMTACGTLVPEQCSSQYVAAAALLDLSNRA